MNYTCLGLFFLGYLGNTYLMGLVKWTNHENTTKITKTGRKYYGTNT